MNYKYIWNVGPMIRGFYCGTEQGVSLTCPNLLAAPVEKFFRIGIFSA